MRIALGVALLCLASGIAAADPVQISTDRAAFKEGGWDAALPALSSDGTRLALPVSGEEYFVAEGWHEQHAVTIVAVGAVTGTEIALWDWDTEFDEAMLADRVRSLNAVLKDGGFMPIGAGQIGASIALTPELTLSRRKGTYEVKLGGKLTATGAAADELAGAWVVGADPVYVYVEEYDDSAQRARDADVSGDPGGTYWTVIPVLAPLQVLDAWLARWRAGDAAGVRALLSTPFEHAWAGAIGYAKKCKKKWIAKKAKQIAATIGCVVAEAASFFVIATPTPELTIREEVALGTLVAPKAVKKKLAKLVKKGHTLVRYESNEEGWSVELVLAVKNGKVAMAFAAVEPFE